jgi:hypothetical protein
VSRPSFLDSDRSSWALSDGLPRELSSTIGPEAENEPDRAERGSSSERGLPPLLESVGDDSGDGTTRTRGSADGARMSGCTVDRRCGATSRCSTVGTTKGDALMPLPDPGST